MAQERDAKRRRLSESLTEGEKEDNNSCSNPGMEQNRTDLPNEVDKQISDLKKEFKTLEHYLDNDETRKTFKILQSKEEKNAELLQYFAALNEEQINKMEHSQVKILTQADQIVDTLIKRELPKWKQRQKMACIGSQDNIRLNHLEKQFSTVAEVLIGLYKQLPKLQDQIKCSVFAERKERTLSLLRNLVTNALVVEKQPVMHKYSQRPLILKIGVQFSMTVRFLANIPEFKNILKVKPAFDTDIHEVKAVKGFRHFDFNRADCEMLEEDKDGGLIAKFGHMLLKINNQKQSRTKGSSENQLAVTEELHIVRFVTMFQYGGLECSIEASSLPVVVISSTSQVPSAWASIMWWNMLSTSEPWNLLLFINPPPLTWEQLSQVLSWQFLTVGKRGLDENQLSMLRDKIVGTQENREVPGAERTTGADVEDDRNVLVDWHKFKNENAWIWIDGILGFIKKHLVDLWHAGHIMGFVSKETIRQLLQEKQAGTFLLHFSESNEDGAITFSWVDHHPEMEPQVSTVKPFTSNELSLTPLADIIYRFRLVVKQDDWLYRRPLCYLYPGIPKDDIFKNYISPERSAPSGEGYLNRLHSFITNDPVPPYPGRDYDLEKPDWDELLSDFNLPAPESSPQS